MNRYIYEGPVMSFGKCIADKWVGETVALSEKKARSNLAFQFKKDAGKVPTFHIELPAKLIVIT